MILRLITGILIGAAVGALLGYFTKCRSGQCPLMASPQRGALLGAVLGAFLASPCGRRCDQPVAATPAVPGNVAEPDKVRKEKVIHVNNVGDFSKHVLEARLPCLVDFFSDSCPPCRMLAPTIETLGEKYQGRAVICKVTLDVQATRGLAHRYNITGIPAVLFFKDGEEKHRLVGLRPEEEYSRALDGIIDK